MDASFIVVSHNTRDSTLACVQSILESVPPKMSTEIIVVDNNSTDDTVERVSKQFPATRIIENAQNVGYGSGQNIGVEKSSGRIIFLMNSDFFLNVGSVVKAVKYLIDTPLALVAFRQVLESGQEQRSIGICPGWFDLLVDLTATKSLALMKGGRLETVGEWRVKNRYVFLDGACLVTSRRCFDMVGGFDSNFFFYAEDADLCFRAQCAGVRQVLLAGEPCTHFRGDSTKRKGIGFEFKARNYVQSYLYFCKKNRSGFEYRLVSLLLPVKFFAYGLAFYVASLIGSGPVEKYRLQFAYLKVYFSMRMVPQ